MNSAVSTSHQVCQAKNERQPQKKRAPHGTRFFCGQRMIDI